MSVEENLNKYIQDKGLKLTRVAELAGMPYFKLQVSMQGKRKLQVEEFLNVCGAIGAEPQWFQP